MATTAPVTTKDRPLTWLQTIRRGSITNGSAPEFVLGQLKNAIFGGPDSRPDLPFSCQQSVSKHPPAP
jgi:hypothetical protein